MSALKRYDLETVGGVSGLVPNEDGRFVLHEVAEALEKENKALKFMLGNLFGMDLSSVGLVKDGETTNVALDKP